MVPPPTEKSLWRAWPYIAVWMVLSTALIFMNSDILNNRMKYPALLTAWHMAVSSVLVRVLHYTAPAHLGLFSEEQPEVSLNTVLTKLMPIAALFSAALAMGNRAYLYCSIAFIQMVKASHGVTTYLLNTLVGAELFMWSKLRLVSLVCFGVMLAVTGELEFHVVGFLCQCFSSVSECTRVVLIGLLLNKSGLKMDPLTALSYYAPMCLVFLVPFAMLTEMPSDWSSFAAEFQEEVGFGLLILNGLVAFALNVSVVLLINATSPVLYILCGVMKDIVIILGSILALHTPVAPQQILGYIAAVVGIQLFNLVSKNPDVFEAHGLVRGVWEVVQQWKDPKPELPLLPLQKSDNESLTSVSTQEGTSGTSESLE